MDRDVEIAPEPSAEEREAVERALARLLGEPDGGVTAWWREGIRENVLGEGSLEERAPDG